MDCIIPKEWKHLAKNFNFFILLFRKWYYSQELIKLIGQFPEKRHFEGFLYDSKSVVGTTDFWIKAQERINKEKN